jgi:hypothetical protein
VLNKGACSTGTAANHSRQRLKAIGRVDGLVSSGEEVPLLLFVSCMI